MITTAYRHNLTIFKLLSTDFVLEDPATAPVGIKPVCGIPRAGNSSLGNIAVRLYHTLLPPTLLTLANCTSSHFHSLSERHRLCSFCRLRSLSHPPLQQAQSCSRPHRAPRDVDNLHCDVHPPTLNHWLDLRPGFRCPCRPHSSPCWRHCLFLLVSARERARCDPGASESTWEARTSTLPPPNGMALTILPHCTDRRGRNALVVTCEYSPTLCSNCYEPS